MSFQDLSGKRKYFLCSELGSVRPGLSRLLPTTSIDFFFFGVFICGLLYHVPAI